MSAKIFNNYLIIFFLCSSIVIRNSSSLPTANQKNETTIIPKTLYEAILEKCPGLKTTSFQVELGKIVDKCSNFTAISATTVLKKEEIINAQCLILYESVRTFCLSLEENLDLLQTRGLIPNISNNPTIQHYNIKQICIDHTNSPSISILKSTEYNITELVKEENCIDMCFDGFEKVADNCKLAYYFATFDTEKLKLKFATKNTIQNKSKLEEIPKATENQNIDHNKKIIISNNEEAEPQKKVPNVTIKPVLVPKEEEVPKKLEQKPNKPTIIEDAKKVVENVDQIKSNNNNNNNNNNQNVAKAIEHSETPNNKPEEEESAVLNNMEPPKPPLEKKMEEKSAAQEVAQAQENPPKLEPSDGNQESPYEGEEEEEENEFVKPEVNKVEPAMPVEDPTVTPSKKVKPNTVEDDPISSYNIPEDSMDGDSYFFSYFTVIMCLVVVGYVGYHNRQKILALVLEGKKGKRTGGRQGMRRPNSANYHKLDSNLEEAISSSCTKNANNVIY